MPCIDSREAEDRRDDRMARAILCGILSATTPPDGAQKLFDTVDWGKTGISYMDAVRWWWRHQQADQGRPT